MKKILSILLIITTPLLMLAQTPAKKTTPAKPAAAKPAAAKPAAAKPTAAQPAGQKKLTTAEANAIVEFNNTMKSFIQQHFSLKNFISGVNGFANEFIQDNIKFTVSRYADDWDTFQGVVNEFKAAESKDPTIIPKCVGAAETANLKTQFKNSASSRQTLLNLKEELRICVGKKEYFTEKKDKAAIDEMKGIINKMYASLDSAVTATDNIYDILADLGDKAEEVTLAGHPMKKEILDMKYVLRKAGKMADIISATESIEEMNTKIAETDKLQAEITTVMTAYANYQTATKGKSTENVRKTVDYFFKECSEKFIPRYIRFKQEYAVPLVKIDKADTWEWRKDKMEDKYKDLLEKYNSFVYANNRE